MPASNARKGRRKGKPRKPLVPGRAATATQREDDFIKRFLDGPRFQIGRWCEHEGPDSACVWCSPSDGETCIGAPESLDAWRLWKLAPDFAQHGRVCWQPVRMAYPRRVAEAIAAQMQETVKGPAVKGDPLMSWPRWKAVHVSKALDDGGARG
jgi:hypothetical protein